MASLKDWLVWCDVRTHYPWVPGTIVLEERAIAVIDPTDPIVAEGIPQPFARWIVYLHNLVVGRVYYMTSCR
jgi:hypothetical protein